MELATHNIKLRRLGVMCALSEEVRHDGEDSARDVNGRTGHRETEEGERCDDDSAEGNDKAEPLTPCTRCMRPI
jgi:hypothetical protein